MRVLVTGAGGFVGRHVVRQLADAGQQVVAVDRDVTALDRAGVEAAAADLEDVAQVTALLARVRPDAIVHLAWYADPGDYLTSPANLASLAMTTRLAEAALSSGCAKLVMAGSCVEYADSDRPRLETDAADPSTLYGACKHAAWTVTRALAASRDAEVAWARIFHIHGPGENERRLIPWVARELRAGKAIELTDGTQQRDHLHVADVAAGLIALLTPGAAGVFNICSGEPVTLRRVLETVADIVGGRDLLKFGARAHRPGEVMMLAGDSGRLRGLGWAPRFSLGDGLADAVRSGA